MRPTSNVYELPLIMQRYFEKMDELGISNSAISRLSGLSLPTVNGARRDVNRITIATAQKIIYAIRDWRNLQQQSLIAARKKL